MKLRRHLVGGERFVGMPLSMRGTPSPTSQRGTPSPTSQRSQASDRPLLRSPSLLRPPSTRQAGWRSDISPHEELVTIGMTDKFAELEIRRRQSWRSVSPNKVGNASTTIQAAERGRRGRVVSKELEVEQNRERAHNAHGKAGEDIVKSPSRVYDHIS